MTSIFLWRRNSAISKGGSKKAERLGENDKNEEDVK